MTPNDLKYDRSQNASTETLTVKPRQAPKRNSILVPLLIAAAAHAVVLGGIAYYYMKNHPAPAGKDKAVAPDDDLKVAPAKALPAPVTAPQAVDTDSAAPESALATAASSADAASKTSASASSASAPAKPVVTTKPAKAKPATKAKAVKSTKSSGKTATKASKTKTKPAAKPASKKVPPKKTQSLDLDALSKINHTKPAH